MSTTEDQTENTTENNSQIEKPEVVDSKNTIAVAIWPKITIDQANGDRLETYEDGTSKLFKTDGTVVETKLNGKTITTNKDGSVDIVLSDNRVCHIRVGYGKDVRESRKFIDMKAADETAFQTAYMSQLITIDGKFVSREELDEIKGMDYIEIESEFSRVNFL